jgi:predicted transcriptional regulator
MSELKTFPVSHVFKYRDRVTIVSDILQSVRNSKEGRKKTQIMQSANLNYAQTKKYLNYLTDCGFLKVTDRQIYVITGKGSEFLLITQMQEIHNLR